MDKHQREYYLNEQIKAIHKELGRKDEKAELDELKKKIEEAGMTVEAKEKALQEFARLEAMPPMSAEGTVADTYGRDHHPGAYSIWMAGGGTKPGVDYGETDEFGYNHIIENPVHIDDFHATVLHLLGLDHEKLVYKHLGRRYRLTDVAGHVVKDIIS